MTGVWERKGNDIKGGQKYTLRDLVLYTYMYNVLL